MKELRIFVVSALFCFACYQGQAQDTGQAIPKWISKKGYWVVESNIHDPLNHQVRFYNNDDILLYKETITGVKLDPDRKRVKMRLKKVLDTTLLAWEKNHKPEEDKNYVLAILK